MFYSFLQNNIIYEYKAGLRLGMAGKIEEYNNMIYSMTKQYQMCFSDFQIVHFSWINTRKDIVMISNTSFM